MEDSHQEEDELEELFSEESEPNTPKDSTPAKGDDSEKVSDELFLKRWNETTGRNDKSVEAIQKHEAEVKKAFAEKGKVKEEQPKIVDRQPISAVIQSLYFDKHPEARDAWAEVEEAAKSLGKDPFELYESSTFLQGEANVKFEAKKKDEANKLKVSKPSNGTASNGVDLASVKPEDVSKLKPSEKLAWMEKQAAIENDNTF